MTLFALSLIVAAAFTHATWNYLSKRVSGGAAFVWLFAALSAILYAPLAWYVFFSQNVMLDATRVLIIAGSGLIHALYFLALQRGYQAGDLSLVYPLARGTGPMLSTFAAILLFGERPSPLALGGALLVVGGVFLLTWSATARIDARGARKNRAWAVGYGLLTGLLIASYTLWDKQAVSAMMIPPIVFENGASFSRAVLLSPIAIRQWSDVKREWRAHPKEILAIALLSPLSYLLVLTAMVTTPVSYVAPARELSILIGAVMGTRLLGERDARRRLIAASAIGAGVVALALG
ncbi:MAG: EamA family transporter [Chloroflexi bacterium]|nr:EamA family transporter [Chloroflexota bacterium]